MKLSTCLTFVISVLYLGTSAGLLYLTYILEVKTRHNPLSEEITSYDINKFFNTSSSKLSLTSFLEIQEIKKKKNLRVLMDAQKCESYKNKILQLNPKDTEEERVTTNLNKVFGIDFVILHSSTYLFFHISCIVTVLFVYFYLVLILSVTCCDVCICLVMPCYPCFVCFFELFAFVYLLLIVVLVYHQYWGSINDFIEFMDCPSVNKDFLEVKYYDIFDIKKYIKYCLYAYAINCIVCWIVSFFTGKEKENIKEYHEDRLSITYRKYDNHDDSIN